MFVLVVGKRIPPRVSIPAVYEDLLSFGVDLNLDVIPAEKTAISFESQTGALTIKVGIANQAPLFWGWTADDSLVISDAAVEILVRQATFEGQSHDVFDPVAVTESLLFDGPLADRTLYRNVKKFQFGQLARFDTARRTVSSSWHWLPRIQCGGPSGQSAQTKAKGLFEELFDRYSDDAGEVVLPITGGFDSRLLAVLANTHGSRIHSYTFQRGWSYETRCARKVCKELGVENQIFDLDISCYREFAKEAVVRSGGLVTGMHTHGIYCCEKLLPGGWSELPRVFGYFGDPITGAMTDDVERGMELTTPEALLQQFDQKTIFPDLVERYRDEILSDLKETEALFRESGSPKHCFFEFWRIHQRQNNLITHIFNYHRAYHGVKVIEPYVNREFVDFFLSLPLESRKDRALFKSVSREIYPRVFSLPSTHFSANSGMAKLESCFARLETAADRLDPCQQWLLSPFKYEQHEKNLMNYLQSDINTGVQQMSMLFDIPSRNVGFPVWKHSSTREYYRLAAFGYLASSEREIMQPPLRKKAS